ncbi:GNAT family N-acetyltransferase [Amycolatopsis benzoatilytica]|uniref:GNAT family N-acetyltransferase n=1 Tax=Amycolatopsis benzoatilytica TaxID=346045 RepID=UPI0003A744A3|nr:GNAT family N-acetyltransferase [Amycolatopsis benzoatilytica]
MSTSPLSNPAWAALTGRQAHFAEQKGQVLRYPVDVSPFQAVPDRPDEHVWQDLADLVGPGVSAWVVGGIAVPAPAGWTVEHEVPGVQMDGSAVDAAPDAEAVRLTEADVPEMLDLTERTKPGPFLPKTIALGTYLGIRRDGALVAMAGERMRLPGWTEISAVCTDPSFQGQGLAGRLVRAVAAEIRERGDRPMLHAAGSNTGAIRLYEKLGFRLAREIVFGAYRTPAQG